MKPERRRSNDYNWRSRKLNAARKRTEENEKRRLVRSKKKRKRNARREKKRKGRSEIFPRFVVSFKKHAMNRRRHKRFFLHLNYRQRIEMAERLKKEEEERNVRRKRVEAIMLRTRGKNQSNTPTKVALCR